MKTEGYNIVSLFNGMGTLRQAFHNLNIPVNNYWISEIKPYANKLQQYHFPDVMQVGDIRKWKDWGIDWSTVDFIGSGSPCQDLSIAGKRAGLSGDNSSLFWVFVEILNHVKSLNPNVKFLQENVGSAPKEAVRTMSEALNILPVRINSNLLTAQNRDRYYWSNVKIRTDWTGYNWTDIPQPEDRKIFLKDIIESGEVENCKSQSLLQSEAKTYSYSDVDKFDSFIKKRLGEGRQVCNFVYEERKKANAILESQSRQEQSQESMLSIHNKGFITVVKEATTKGYVEVNPGDCVDLSFPTSKTRRGRLMTGKVNCLMEAGQEFHYNGFYLRKLTQTELERLQGFSDGYTSILSYNQAASVLGDGWTLPVIEHILKHL